jgi:hypothetical protein
MTLKVVNYYWLSVREWLFAIDPVQLWRAGAGQLAQDLPVEYNHIPPRA